MNIDIKEYTKDVTPEMVEALEFKAKIIDQINQSIEDCDMTKFLRVLQKYQQIFDKQEVLEFIKLFHDGRR